MDERAARVGVNEALFRAVNDRIENLNESFAAFTDAFEIVCECGDLDCAVPIPIAPGAYRRVRGGASLFILVPGHEAAGTEEVVDKQAGYHIVRKHGLAQQAAEQADPQS